MMGWMSPAAPAPSGAITDVAGIEVGHFTDTRRPTGCTVVLARQGAVAGVDVRGAAPGTRETDLLQPGNLVERVHAVMLAGGSAWGLDAASGAMRWLEEQGIGMHRRPRAGAHRAGRRAVRPATWAIRGAPGCSRGPCGLRGGQTDSTGRGQRRRRAGAIVGKIFGIEQRHEGRHRHRLGARRRRHGRRAHRLQRAGRRGRSRHRPAARRGPQPPTDGAAVRHPPRPAARRARPAHPPAPTPPSACIATDAVLTKAQAQRLATVGHDGLARSINPAHTMFDGDTLFALGTGASGNRRR
jgi:L-aminopeptidase/D-esterase-like protein